MGKRILITGGTKGIGLETVNQLIDRGHNIIVIGRDFSKFPFENSGQVKTIAFDVSKVEEIPALVSEIGEIDVLINNAGIAKAVSYFDYTPEQKEHIIKVNLDAPVTFIREVSRYFLKKGEGRVVNVASQAAQVGHPDIWYGITKAGLINATISFANLLGEKGIAVNAVAPGPVSTDMIKTAPPNKRLEQVLHRTYLGRAATAAEVAEVIVWLAAESPAYVNGEVININNGVQYVKNIL
ncbi:SDR family NAD(P)-dependent oxidoreductase [Ruminiclostridium cellobioparum]|uniref:Short-chain dehydrogenase/reductase SDR n=1 Tax=Ruminiclostridium cellobioparum subsp. termitidis CT1112 TaxID=1195236 RepID=S0FRR0_RUMCE|nr:SDR family oxidoreductase [Ruminiclostridium cellobioparum]EMS71839.1 short-chain dehydrogenase/reductase SDR [Ruminiclostridium cellobioparum subsp. termitidis CT1112]